MVERLGNTLLDAYSNDYFSQEFQTTMEYHIPRLKALETTRLADLKNGISLKYDHDLYGLLSEMAIPFKYHWVIMRCNDFLSPMDFDKSITSIVIPDFDYIDDQFSIFQTARL